MKPLSIPLNRVAFTVAHILLLLLIVAWFRGDVSNDTAWLGLWLYLLIVVQSNVRIELWRQHDQR